MNFEFTPEQAKHAQEVANMLFKQRRFFFPAGMKSLPFLDTEIFGYLYHLNDEHEHLYRSAAEHARLRLLRREAMNGIAPATLKEGQSIVECKRYTGGLEIVGIVPLAVILPDMFKSEHILLDELFEEHLPSEARTNMSEKQVWEEFDRFTEYMRHVLREYSTASKLENFKDKMLVVLETRFLPASLDSDDFMHGKLAGLITYPYLTSYLYYKQALAGNRFSQRVFTTFTTLRSGHISLEITPKQPVLTPNKLHGYDCKVAFATIL